MRRGNVRDVVAVWFLFLQQYRQAEEVIGALRLGLVSYLLLFLLSCSWFFFSCCRLVYTCLVDFFLQVIFQLFGHGWPVCYLVCVLVIHEVRVFVGVVPVGAFLFNLIQTLCGHGGDWVGDGPWQRRVKAAYLVAWFVGNSGNPSPLVFFPR